MKGTTDGYSPVCEQPSRRAEGLASKAALSSFGGASARPTGTHLIFITRFGKTEELLDVAEGGMQRQTRVGVWKKTVGMGPRMRRRAPRDLVLSPCQALSNAHKAKLLVQTEISLVNRLNLVLL
jgi:hypothetical protein